MLKSIIVDYGTPIAPVVQIPNGNRSTVSVQQVNGVAMGSPSKDALPILYLIEVFPTYAAYAFCPGQQAAVIPYSCFINIGMTAAQLEHHPSEAGQIQQRQPVK